MDAHSNTAKTPAVRPGNGNRPDQRSRITNHNNLLPGLDGRSSAARRFRDLVNSYVSDAGGLSECSEIRLGLIRRLASIVVQSEILELKMANGEEVDVAILCQLASTTVRISSRLGLDRRQREIVPDPLTYAREAAK